MSDTSDIPELSTLQKLDAGNKTVFAIFETLALGKNEFCFSHSSNLSPEAMRRYPTCSA